MIPIIKQMICREIGDNLEMYWPHNIHNFGFWLSLAIGPRNEENSDYFEIFVCTPEWISNQCEQIGGVWGLHMLVVKEYDFDIIRGKINWQINKCNANTWSEFVKNMRKYVAWEYDGI